jgi:peptide/nickel transport system permease protein
MRAYILRRLLLMIPTLLLITVIIFLLARLIPGSAIDIMLSQQPSANQYTRSQIEHDLGLDIPIHIQYVRWLSNIVTRGDLGRSLWTNESVAPNVIRRFPVSFELGAIGTIVGLIIALPVGIYSAIRQDTVGDYLARGFAIACIALPSFWLGTLVMVFPSVWWKWSPPVEYVSFFQNPGQNLQMFLVPGIILGMGLSGITMRMTRTMMLEVLRQDYIRTAWSKGLTERMVVLRHAMKNALIPIVTIIGLQIPVLIGGSIVLEKIFQIPGIGHLMVDVIFSRDYPILQGINLFMAVTVLVINLGVDLAYAYLDPRIHYG